MRKEDFKVGDIVKSSKHAKTLKVTCIDGEYINSTIIKADGNIGVIGNNWIITAFEHYEKITNNTELYEIY